jgi:type IV pilus assembly protein PilV
MNRSNNLRARQQGSMLLEALIAILIFSVGILALVGLQAASIKNTTDAKFRSDAAFLANKVIAQMWVADTATGANLATLFNTGGAGYNAWLADVQAGLPAATGAIAVAPGVMPGSNVATVTLGWQAPGDNTAHSYVASAQITK